MTEDVCSIEENDDLSNLLQTMQVMRFRHTPVTDGNHLVGLLSERDVLRVSASSLLPHAEQQDQFVQQHFRVRDVMNRELTTVSPDTPLQEATQLLLQQRVGCLPVVDENNVLLGIVTESDLLRVLADLLPAS